MKTIFEKPGLVEKIVDLFIEHNLSVNEVGYTLQAVRRELGELKLKKEKTSQW